MISKNFVIGSGNQYEDGGGKTKFGRKWNRKSAQQVNRVSQTSLAAEKLKVVGAWISVPAAAADLFLAAKSFGPKECGPVMQTEFAVTADGPHTRHRPAVWPECGRRAGRRTGEGLR